MRWHTPPLLPCSGGEKEFEAQRNYCRRLQRSSVVRLDWTSGVSISRIWVLHCGTAGLEPVFRLLLCMCAKAHWSQSCLTSLSELIAVPVWFDCFCLWFQECMGPFISVFSFFRCMLLFSLLIGITKSLGHKELCRNVHLKTNILGDNDSSSSHHPFF